jgi:hypothetical protein
LEVEARKETEGNEEEHIDDFGVFCIDQRLFWTLLSIPMHTCDPMSRMTQQCKVDRWMVPWR